MRVHIPVSMRWGDLDAYNHLNNVQVLRILEEARVRAFWTAETGDSAPTAVVSAKVGSDTLTLIAGHVIEYVAQVEYQREPLDVQLWIGRIGGASADVSYEVYAEGELAIRAESTMVFIDSVTGRPRRISAEERTAWEPYFEPPIVFKRDTRPAANR